jgi:hypothetical protein
MQRDIKGGETYTIEHLDDGERVRALVLSGRRRVHALVRTVDLAGGGAVPGEEERVALGDDVELALGGGLDGLGVVLLLLEYLREKKRRSQDGVREVEA